MRRFDANTYLVLSEAMNHHDVGRDRGGIAAALATVTADVDHRRHVVGPALPAAPAAGARRAHPDVVGVSRSSQTISGHDGFLVESDAVGAIIRRAME